MCASDQAMPITRGEVYQMATEPAELSPTEKQAVDALANAWGEFASETDANAESIVAWARAVQSVCWKLIEDIHEVAHATPSRITNGLERFRSDFLAAEADLLAQPGLNDAAFRAYLPEVGSVGDGLGR
jgi:hypothetical protein